jgi:hypothetical protein
MFELTYGTENSDGKPPVPWSDYRAVMVDEMDLDQVERDLDERYIAWLEADRELYEAGRWIRQVRDQLAKARKRARDRYDDDEWAELTKARSKDERQAKGEELIEANPDVVAQSAEMASAEENKHAAQWIADRALEELKHMRSKRSALLTRIRFLQTVPSVPVRLVDPALGETVRVPDRLLVEEKEEEHGAETRISL